MYHLLFVALTIFIVVIVIVNLAARAFPNNKLCKSFLKNPLGTKEYLGIIILLFIIIWPDIQEGSIGGISFKKEIETLETRVETIESSVDELIERQKTESFTLEEVNKFRYYEEEESNFLEIQLSTTPVPNALSLWFEDHLTNPFNYDVSGDKVTISLSKTIDMEYIQSAGERGEYLIVVSYFEARPTD